MVRYRGRGDTGRKPILLMAHLDVVAANPEDWELDPFTMHEQDGYFIGRGTRDDKDDAAVHISNLIRMKREGFQPDRDIIVALTADEETGDQNGITWLLENHREFIDVEYALNEGGDGLFETACTSPTRCRPRRKSIWTINSKLQTRAGIARVPRKDTRLTTRRCACSDPSA